MHIVLTGPESTGKTTLAYEIQKRLGGLVVPEYAREYLRNNGPEYNQQDLRSIAFGQFSAQLSGLNRGSGLVISDTCLLTIEVWEEWKYGQLDPFISEWKSLQQIDYYLLCKNDLSWEYDPIRENENDLDRLFEIYRSKIALSGIPFSIVSGQDEERLKNALLAIEQLNSEKVTSLH